MDRTILFSHREIDRLIRLTSVVFMHCSQKLNSLADWTANVDADPGLFETIAWTLVGPIEFIENEINYFPEKTMIKIGFESI